ncbi:putative non-specific serine/threonine protein kinase [Rosa chinensis]|uniref:Putative non-specific serine/threonine protein kinase n=1 Tax=Rosa chinensis TaxID=74649 RepID=A0A2P6PFY3_ROSCH|nr:putative non-specific serine/threonine protein kinase [Rosa chinensis]
MVASTCILLDRSFNSIVVLSWKQRLCLPLHIFMKTGWKTRDVKACNIMIDADFSGKLGDCGLTEVYEHNIMTRAATNTSQNDGVSCP